MTTSEPVTATELSAYENLARPFGWLLMLCLPLLILVPAALYGGDYRAQIETMTRHTAVGAVAFFANCWVFAAFWLIYFSSGWTKVRRIQTLRTLLMIHSDQWGAEDNPERIAGLRAKANSTMITQAIFIAIAVLIISALARDSYVIGGAKIGLIDHWVAIASLATATGSFTLLLVSTDAAETMFNNFVKVREERAVSRLYRISARLKYYGFVLCFMSLSLFAFTMHAAVASLAVVLFLFVGYSYWYPDVSEGLKHGRERIAFQVLLVGANLCMGFHAF